MPDRFSSQPIYSDIFIEQLWRSLEYEATSLHEIAVGFTERCPIRDRTVSYNIERPHAAPDGRTPAEACRSETPVDLRDKLLRALPTSAQAQRQLRENRFMGIPAA